VLGLLAGGLVAAPIAAYLVRHVPTRLLGVAVGGVIIATNSRSLMNVFDVSASTRLTTYLSIAVVWLVFLGLALQGMRRDRRETADTRREELAAA
jgi:hypothetical protein